MRHACLFLNLFVFSCYLIQVISGTIFLPSRLYAEEIISKKIGVIIPLSGPLAKVGEAVKNSIILADEKFDTKSSIEFIFEDDSFIPKNTISAFSKLSNQDNVEAIYVFGSNTSLSVANIAERSMLPMVALGMSENISKGKDYVVRLCATTASLSELVKTEVVNRAYKKIAILTTQQDAMLDAKENFTIDSPVSIILNEDFNPEERDFRTVATKIADLKPDAVYILLMPPQAAIFAKQARSLGYAGDFFGTPPLGEYEQIKVAGDAFTDAWYVTGDDKKADSFYKLYQSKYGYQPIVEAIYAYDSAKLLIEAVYHGDINKSIHRETGFTGLLANYNFDETNTYLIPVGVHKITKNGIKRLG
ncbi:MAG: ABC transporter substrate-binding protein [Bdellovibrionales bacterium]|nr:ABC transporter substrate-binding protein [Bdellovibrionales bacterium]